MPIFDQGYQHWRGALSGHSWRWLAIARHGVRVQMKNRFLRFLLLLAWLPALVLIAFMVIWGLVEQGSETFIALLRVFPFPPEMLLSPRDFRSSVWVIAYIYFFWGQLIFIMLMVMVAGPGLISSDLRFNALPLYFVRPLTRLDYFLGKLGVIGALVAAVAVGPALFAYVAGACFSFDLSVVKDTYHVVFATLGYGLVITLSAGTLILALSSMSKRSIYVGIAWAALWLISSMVGQAMTEMYHHSVRQEIRQGQIDRSAMLREDWRPMCAYFTNLRRIGEELFKADDAWLQIGTAFEKSRSAARGFGPAVRAGGGNPAATNERMLADENALQYPWQWSAGLLAGLLGISTWTLLRRVKSLDRLK
ncbi:MAG: hypothetical protein HY040_27010 [Planctomycetes bacterium]|nr:hypothetical protein [Planctomycetota bacterium]